MGGWPSSQVQKSRFGQFLNRDMLVQIYMSDVLRCDKSREMKMK